jgi:adenosylcobinamide-GDP ribazoletransferase
VAFQFLTSIPLFESRDYSPEELSRSMGAFPLVGLALGGGLALVHLAVGRLLPAALEGAVLVGLLAWATGALHLDGLSDTVDGLAGGWTAQRSLEIMKDSRTGAVGAAALCLVLLTKALGLGLLPEGIKTAGILLTPAVARGSLVYLAYGSEYARPGGGLGTPYLEYLDSGTLRMALIWSGLLCLFLGWRGLAAFALVLLYTRWLKGLFQRRVGGVTGDTFGFAEETGEALFLVALQVLY